MYKHRSSDIDIFNDSPGVCHMDGDFERSQEEMASKSVLNRDATITPIMKTTVGQFTKLGGSLVH